MSFERVSFLDVLEASYSAYYNIIKENLPEDLPLAFRADYFKRDESFWLSKNIKMWENEMNEFAYVFSADSFDGETVEKCISFALEEGLARVRPHRNHQYSNIKTVFIASSFSDDAVKAICKNKFQKVYKHSLWGFSSLIACGVDVDNEKTVTNPAGREMKRYFRRLFKAQRKGRSA